MSGWDVAVQPCPISRVNCATTTSQSQDAACQTNELEGVHVKSEGELSFSSWPAGSPVEAVARALKSTELEMIEQLKRGSTSGVGSFLRTQFDTEDEEISVIGSLVHKFMQFNETLPASASAKDASVGEEETLPCTGTVWSQTGATVAAGFGYRRHAGWCRHRSGVIVWNPFNQSGPSSIQHGLITLPTPSCVSSLCFHPVNPSILAAGLQSGEVLVWDLSASRAELGAHMRVGPSAEEVCYIPVARTRIDDFLHRETVCGLSWATVDSQQQGQGQAREQHVLLSLSADGKGHVWSLGNTLDHPISSFSLSISGRSRLIAFGADRRRGRGPGGGGENDSDDEESNRRPVQGRTNKQEILTGCSSLCILAGGRFGLSCVAGGDTGAILQCAPAMPQNGLASAIYGEGSAWRPIVAAGGIARGETTLPWEQAAADCVLRVPDIERAVVCRDIERYAREARAATVTMGVLYRARPQGRFMFPNATRFGHAPHSGDTCSVSSSPFHRNVFASAGTDGVLRLWSTLLERPLLALQPSVNAAGAHPLLAVAWSRTRPLVLACACADGRVYVYDLWVSTAMHVAVLATEGTNGGSGAGKGPGMGMAQGAPASAATSLSFNTVHRRALSVGYSCGTVRVWRLPWSVCTGLVPGQAEEEQALRLLLLEAMRGEEEGEGREQVSVVQQDDDIQRPNSLANLLRHN